MTDQTPGPTAPPEDLPPPARRRSAAAGAHALSARDLASLRDWRRVLHRHPDLSRDEGATAGRVLDMLRLTAPDGILTGLGGHGLAAIYEGAAAGPTVLLRCELDALPIAELPPAGEARPHRSQSAGRAHLCGHDGHMAILAGVARALGRRRPDRGRAVLLFQPAEEDGSGAAAVIADPKFGAIRPDLALSLHNFPGLARGRALLRTGVMNCASRGMRIALSGWTAHAAQPEAGRSPAPALAALIPALAALGRGLDADDPNFALVTITHAVLGEAAFGIAPGAAEIWATLRAKEDATMGRLVARAEAAVARAAAAHGLGHRIDWQDVFQSCTNHPQATAVLGRALAAEGIAIDSQPLPMRASEDFGRFGALCPSAMLLLGAGAATPVLHHPAYDFPDALIGPGARIFLRCLAETLGG